ncbi:hypothetical protein PITC_042720 [Penicillium italicum]|uniref:Uncharacterized protein n=1 Tax=Penicillium italicum TaxID=40296 RepID=A0A0A2KPX7_PENIT|nr:hypothetical protein PITC_042720 [Penicillium italicum]
MRQTYCLLCPTTGYPVAMSPPNKYGRLNLSEDCKVGLEVSRRRGPHDLHCID